MWQNLEKEACAPIEGQSGHDEVELEIQGVPKMQIAPPHFRLTSAIILWYLVGKYSMKKIT